MLLMVLSHDHDWMLAWGRGRHGGKVGAAIIQSSLDLLPMRATIARIRSCGGNAPLRLLRLTGSSVCHDPYRFDQHCSVVALPLGSGASLRPRTAPCRRTGSRVQQMAPRHGGSESSGDWPMPAVSRIPCLCHASSRRLSLRRSTTCVHDDKSREVEREGCCASVSKQSGRYYE